MSVMNYDQDDMLRSVIVPPDWYNVKIKEVESATSKDGESQNWFVRGNIVGGNFDNVPVSNIFNSKQMFRSVTFARAVGADLNETGGSFDPVTAEGVTLQAFVVKDVYGGTPKNKMEAFLPLDAPKPAKPAADPSTGLGGLSG